MILVKAKNIKTGERTNFLFIENNVYEINSEGVSRIYDGKDTINLYATDVGLMYEDTDGFFSEYKKVTKLYFHGVAYRVLSYKDSNSSKKYKYVKNRNLYNKKDSPEVVIE